jgi:bifunctional non-homologous end joining protein LigD
MTWVGPVIVVQVKFLDWTAEGRLRHAAYVGLRLDKTPQEVRREI